MTTQAQLINMARRAPQDFRTWAAFVAYTEYLWHDTALEPDGVACNGSGSSWRSLMVLRWQSGMSKAKLMTGRFRGARLIIRTRTSSHLSWSR